MSERDPDKGREKPKFFLYDLVAQKTIVELPFGERNTMLGDFPPKWTAGGRYLYYNDVEVPDDAPRGARKYLVRIWDRTENKEAGIIEKAIPIGPGPGKTTMVLALREDRSVVLHDATTGKKFVLFAANKKVQLLFAGGGKIVYARRFASGKIEYHVARIHVPDEGEKKSTPEGNAIPVRQ